MNLSERVRPGSEAAPWVVDEIKLLEDALAAARKAYEDEREGAHHMAGVVLEQKAALAEVTEQRDAGYARNDHLQELLNVARTEIQDLRGDSIRMAQRVLDVQAICGQLARAIDRLTNAGG